MTAATGCLLNSYVPFMVVRNDVRETREIEVKSWLNTHFIEQFKYSLLKKGSMAEDFLWSCICGK